MLKQLFAIVTALLLLCTTLFGCTQPAEANPAPVSSQEVSLPNSSQESLPASSASEAASSAPSTSKIENPTITSKAIAANLLDENTERVLTVYLPPSYETSTKAYPVVYYLHGFGDSARAFVVSAKKQLDEMFADGTDEFILVGIDGNNKSGGSFYVNSPVTGSFEDYVTQEVVAYIDSSYRTLAAAASRGLCGFSMGGFGTVNLALKHPDIYGAMYAMSPGIAKTDSFNDVLDTWKYDSAVTKAYGQAFAPSPDGEAPYFTKLTLDGSAADNALLAKWIDGYANWDKKLNDYLAKSTPLHGIGISYGDSDSYGWIPEGCEYFIGLLKQNGIEPSVNAFKGGHMIPVNASKDILVPFFREHLTF